MGDSLAASGRVIAADCHIMFWVCGAGHHAADQKYPETVDCGYHKTPAVTGGCWQIYGNVRGCAESLGIYGIFMAMKQEEGVSVCQKF